jgi:putative spermidine/putrescine transport system permease protein
MKLTWKVKLWRSLIILIVGTYLLLPLYSMLDFSTKPFLFGQQGRTLDAWKVIPSQPDLTIAVVRSMVSAAIVMFLILVLIVPTVVWVHLKLPKLKRIVELICLIPLAIPAIVIVVGIAPLYRWIAINHTLIGIFDVDFAVHI